MAEPTRGGTHSTQALTMITRRNFVSGMAVAAGGAALSHPARASAAGAEAAHGNPGASEEQKAEAAPGQPGLDYIPVVTPNGVAAEWKLIDGAKVFHLIAEEFDHEFAPGLHAKCWGYNGRTPGPTIEAVEGDKLRIYVTNRLPEPTTIHWHGILLANGMDGVAGLTQKEIAPGETHKYEFTLRQSGTHMYHPHFDEMTQMALGMMGMFVIHPRQKPAETVDRDFAIMLSEWRIDPGASRPNPSEMTDFNILTMNSKAFPGTAPLVAKRGERVRVRLGNLGAMEHHPIHLHGNDFLLTEIDGGAVPHGARMLQNTVLVPVGATRAFEFVANELGDWAMHCHMTHHTMNQMGHGNPNFLGVKSRELDKNVRKLLPGYMTMGETGMGDMAEMGMKNPRNTIPMLGAPGPFSYIDMGGMFTVVKVREGITSYEDPGWYSHPPGTVATVASDEEMQRDLGIVPPGRKPPEPLHKHG